MRAFILASKLRCLVFIVCISCATCAICLSSCMSANYQVSETERSLTNYANFPHTLILRGLSVDYPEEFDISKESDVTLVLEDMRCSGKRQTIANSDYSIFFTVEVYEGIGFDDIERNLASQIDKVQNGLPESSEAVPEFNIPEGYNLLFTREEPEFLSLNGSRALLTIIGRTDIEGAFVYDYYVSMSENSVGKVRVGYTYEEYEANSALYDGVIASIRVDAL